MLVAPPIIHHFLHHFLLLPLLLPLLTFKRAGEGEKVEEIPSRAEVGVGIAELGAELLEEGIERRSKEFESDAEAVVKRLEDGHRKCHLLGSAVRSEKRLIPGL